MAATVRMQRSACATAIAVRCLCVGAAVVTDLRRQKDGADKIESNDGAVANGGVLEDGGYYPSVINATKAVERIRSLPGPDFTKGDAAWRTRLAALVARKPDAFSKTHTETHENSVALAAAAPLTTLYVLARNHGRLFPNGALPRTLRVHVLGAAYTFEGRGDWRLLGEAMPPGVSLEVSLVVGTPREADGVQEVRRMRLLKELVCRRQGAANVSCIESYYQDVMKRLPRPHLALMFNPGFPQVHRRTWDRSLLFLLKHRIPTAVSAQVTSGKGYPRAGEPWDSSFYSYANEDFAIHSTLEAYGAEVLSTTGSPFFVVSPRSGRTDFIKNGVIELFQGLRQGAVLASPPAAVPPEDVKFLNRYDWRTAERITDDDTLHDEMRSALLTPVSDAFVRAADTVYLRFLQDAIDFGRMRTKNGFSLRGNAATVLRRVRTIMIRMKRMEPLGAQDWVFLKTALDLD